MHARLENLSSNTLRDLITLAAACPQMDEDGASTRNVPDTLGSGANTEYMRCYRNLIEALNQLTPAQKVEAMALMWLGRASTGETVEDWQGLIEHALESLDEGSMGYLAGHSNLGEYLEAGWRKVLAVSE